jgi:hypothetical protein
LKGRRRRRARVKGFARAQQDHLEALLALLDAGASPDVIDHQNFTLLMIAADHNEGRNRRAIIETLIRRSLPETLRATDSNDLSAADWLVWFERADDNGTVVKPFEPWHLSAVQALTRAGAPLRPDLAAALLPSAAAHANRLNAEFCIAPL